MLVLNRISPLLLSCIAGLLLVFAWPVSPLAPLIFIGWVPLFYLAEMEKKRSRFFWFSFLSMLIWNTGTTWWIWNSTAPGAVGAIVANSFLMCLPLTGYHIFNDDLPIFDIFLPT